MDLCTYTDMVTSGMVADSLQQIQCLVQGMKPRFMLKEDIQNTDYIVLGACHMLESFQASQTTMLTYLGPYF